MLKNGGNAIACFICIGKELGCGFGDSDTGGELREGMKVAQVR